MHRKRSLLFHKVVSNISIRIPNLRRPIIPKLLLPLFKIKRTKKNKEFKLLREYQFSPSSTPLIIPWNRKNRARRREFRGLCSLLFLLRCVADLKSNGVDEVQHQGIMPLAAINDDKVEVNNAVVVAEDFVEEDSGDQEDDDDDESVDLKAERFIQRFYQEMKMQMHQ